MIDLISIEKISDHMRQVNILHEKGHVFSWIRTINDFIKGFDKAKTRINVRCNFLWHEACINRK